MADRGDVFQLARRLGYVPGRDGERVVVVQATKLNEALPTVLVVPLDRRAGTTPPYQVVIPAAEAGSPHDHVAVPSLLRVVARSALEPVPVGKLATHSLQELDHMLQLVLDL